MLVVRKEVAGSIVDCFETQVRYPVNKVEEVEEEQIEEVHVTYTANDVTNIPDWIKLVKENQN